jgi:flagellar M-ring protein FliF
MPAFLSEILAQLRAIWARLDGGQRLVVVTVLLATTAGLGAIVWFAGRPDWRALRTFAEPRELALAAAALDQRGVPYRIDGGTITVEASRQDEARAAMLAEGLTGGGDPDAGDESLASMTLDSASKAHLLAQKQRRLAESNLMQLGGVRRATVSFHKPRRELLAYGSLGQENRPTANAVLVIAPGESFRRIARSAVHTVSAALGVPTDAVTIVDATTKEIWREEPDRGTSLDSTDFLAMQRAWSERLTEQAQRMLNPLYPDQAHVLVTVDLDPSWEIRQTDLVPSEPLIKRQRTETDDSRSAQPAQAGDPSLTAAITNASATAPVEARGPTQKRSTSEKEFETRIGTAQSGKLAPEVRRISVALVLDESLALEQTQLDTVTKMVKNAVGWDEQRDGGGFAIHVDQFKEAAPVEPESGGGIGELAAAWGPTAGQVAAVLVVLLFLRSLLRRSQLPRSAAAAQATGPERLEELAPEEQVRRMRREIETAIGQDPAAISRMIESWLAEQKA